MTAETIEKIIGAAIVVALLAFAALFVYQGADEHVDALIVCALGIVAYVVKSPRDGGGPKVPPALMLMLIPLVGCGATPREQHEVLNRITLVADPTYVIAVDTCDEARNFIIAREGTTYEEDRRAFDGIHQVCDGIVEGFESLRGTQLTARAAINAGAEGAIRTAILEALALWGRLQAMIPELSTLGRAGDTATSGGES